MRCIIGYMHRRSPRQGLAAVRCKALPGKFKGWRQAGFFFSRLDIFRFSVYAKNITEHVQKEVRP